MKNLKPYNLAYCSNFVKSATLFFCTTFYKKSFIGLTITEVAKRNILVGSCYGRLFVIPTKKEIYV